MSSYRVNICKLSMGQLDARCLIKANELAQLLEKINPKIKINTDNEQIFGDLVRIAKENINNPDVQRLYVSTKEEISRYINSPRFAKVKDVPLIPIDKTEALHNKNYR